MVHAMVQQAAFCRLVVACLGVIAGKSPIQREVFDRATNGDLVNQVGEQHLTQAHAELRAARMTWKDAKQRVQETREVRHQQMQALRAAKRQVLSAREGLRHLAEASLSTQSTLPARRSHRSNSAADDVFTETVTSMKDPAFAVAPSADSQVPDEPPVTGGDLVQQMPTVRNQSLSVDGDDISEDREKPSSVAVDKAKKRSISSGTVAKANSTLVDNGLSDGSVVNATLQAMEASLLEARREAANAEGIARRAEARMNRWKKRSEDLHARAMRIKNRQIRVGLKEVYPPLANEKAVEDSQQIMHDTELKMERIAELSNKVDHDFNVAREEHEAAVLKANELQERRHMIGKSVRNARRENGLY